MLLDLEAILARKTWLLSVARRGVFVISTLLPRVIVVHGGYTIYDVGSRTLETVAKLRGMHRSCTFRRVLLSIVQMGQAVTRKVRLSLVDVGVSHKHATELVLTSGLRIVGGAGIVSLLSTVNIYISRIFEGIRVLGDLEN